MHLPNDEKNSSSKQQPKTTKSAQTQTGAGDQHEVPENQVTESSSVATTHVEGSRICFQFQLESEESMVHKKYKHTLC
jgi:hypothetical protein